MKTDKLFTKGMVLGILVLFIGAVVVPSISGNRSIPDPDRSFVTLTGDNYEGLRTCPQGDGGPYQYIKVTCIDAMDTPIQGIPAGQFQIVVGPGDASWFGDLSCTITAVDAQTNAAGEIRFEIEADTSIIGNITIEAIVQGIAINDVDLLECITVDFNLDGTVSLGDFGFFAPYYGLYHRWCDYNWDGTVSLADFGYFAPHYGHVHP